MTLTFLSAQYANDDDTAVEATTAEAGSVLLSQLDTPADWTALLQSGVSIAAYVAPVEPLTPLDARQIRLGLFRNGTTPDQVDAIIDGLPEPAKTEAQIAWQHSALYHRDAPLLASIAVALNLTNEQVDTFWREAMAL